MRDYTKFPEELKGREKILYDFILHNPGISVPEIVNRTKMNHNTVYKYVKLLCSYGLVDPVELKQGVIAYYHRTRRVETFAESHIRAKNEFNQRRKLIRKCINSLENLPHQKAVQVYSNCIKLILSYDKAIKFIISFHKRKKPVKQWLDLQEENQELLDEITTEMSGTLYGRILVDLDKTDREILDELEFLSKQNIKNL